MLWTTISKENKRMGEGDASTDGDANAGFKGLEVSVMLEYGFFFFSLIWVPYWFHIVVCQGQTEYSLTENTSLCKPPNTSGT